MTMKRKGALVHPAIWMTLKNFMLSERSETQKTKSCLTAFIKKAQDR